MLLETRQVLSSKLIIQDLETIMPMSQLSRIELFLTRLESREEELLMRNLTLRLQRQVITIHQVRLAKDRSLKLERNENLDQEIFHLDHAPTTQTTHLPRIE